MLARKTLSINSGRRKYTVQYTSSTSTSYSTVVVVQEYHVPRQEPAMHTTVVLFFGIGTWYYSLGADGRADTFLFKNTILQPVVVPSTWYLVVHQPVLVAAVVLAGVHTPVVHQ